MGVDFNTRGQEQSLTGEWQTLVSSGRDTALTPGRTSHIGSMNCVWRDPCCNISSANKVRCNTSENKRSKRSWLSTLLKALQRTINKGISRNAHNPGKFSVSSDNSFCSDQWQRLDCFCPTCLVCANHRNLNEGLILKQTREEIHTELSAICWYHEPTSSVPLYTLYKMYHKQLLLARTTNKENATDVSACFCFSSSSWPCCKIPFSGALFMSTDCAVFYSCIYNPLFPK